MVPFYGDRYILEFTRVSLVQHYSPSSFVTLFCSHRSEIICSIAFPILYIVVMLIHSYSVITFPGFPTAISSFLLFVPFAGIYI